MRLAGAFSGGPLPRRSVSPALHGRALRDGRHATGCAAHNKGPRDVLPLVWFSAPGILGRGKRAMPRDLSVYVNEEDSAKSLIGDLEEGSGATRFRGHVIGAPGREVNLGLHDDHFDALLSRPALNSYVSGGVRQRSILSFGVFDGFQIGRLYLRNTIRSAFLRPYKFITLTIVCSDQPRIYRGDQTDRAHFSIGLRSQAFEMLGEIVRLKQMCSVRIPTPVWKGPSLNYVAMEASEKNYPGEISFSARDDDALDFGHDDLTRAAYGA